ncbi:MAG: SusD/RagB family nutrient-binding outer membrane lipoprotein [Prevotella sp.]|nr:SusD/RagB family nutrient-binding outer membrane lipoprotein [Prevotella sp.]
MNYNILKNIKTVLASTLLCSLFLVSCTNNFEDMNRNPAEPTDDEILEGYYKLGAFFPQMLNYAYPAQENAYQMGENLIGDPYGRYLSIANTWSSNFSTFNAPSGWINSPFNDAFEKVYGGWTQVKEQTGGEGQLFAWAQIIRVTAMQRITDMYGPIPYSQVGSGSLGSAYDSQEDVYKNMFTDLDAAIAELTTFVAENPSYNAMAKFDKVYSGDFTKWIKYANSLKLRMALRIVYADPALAKQKAEEAVSHPIGVIVNNNDNTQNAFPQNPIWTMTTAWGDSRVCADIIAYMAGYDDPRMAQYFTKSQVEGGPEYLGLRTGITISGKDWADRYSSTTYSQTAPTLWMAASEIAFLKAEGALRGWSMGGTAKDLYEEGVRLSFSQWLASGADTYLEDATSKPGDYADPDSKLAAKAVSTITIKWNDADPFETKLERLITQKWIAMYPLGQEAWSEQRRTGYPHFFPVLVNASDDPNLTTRLASRIPFAPDEKNNNAQNYENAVKLLGGADNYSTKLWWDKNPNKGW